MSEFEPGTTRTYELTPALCRAARGLLGWRQKKLAALAQVGVSTLADFERGARSPHRTTLRALARTLETAGIRFVHGPEIGVLKR